MSALPPPPPYVAATSSTAKPMGVSPSGRVLHSHSPYGSPPRPSSLGTPHIPNWNRSSPHQPSYFAAGPVDPNAPQRDLLLVPTRPLLKALARECKPSPPWAVGSPVPATMGEELHLFARFLLMTPQEREKCDSLTAAVGEVCRTVWGATAAIYPMGVNAAGVYPPKEATLHFYSLETTIDDGTQEKFRVAANDMGFQVEYMTDYRNCPTVLLTDARSGERCAIRYGPQAAEAKPTADLLATAIAAVEERRCALVAIDALLRQNKVLDETGINSSGIAPEAVAVMLLAICNSYGEDDAPDAGRLLTDFFLTFGFPAHFDNAATSISHKGMAHSQPKLHKDAQLSILDPSEPTRNLTQKADKVPHVMAVFNYCYTALSQFNQTHPQQRRAQSVLSTIIGGETYWSRVLQLYHQQISPYVEVVRERQHVLAQMR